jgi:hypothetical protein
MSTYLTPHLFSSTTKQIAILLSLSHQAASFVCHTTKEGAHYFPKAIKVNTEPTTTTLPYSSFFANLDTKTKLLKEETNSKFMRRKKSTNCRDKIGVGWGCMLACGLHGSTLTLRTAY